MKNRKVYEFVYDSIVIGDGFAGLSAGIFLARYLRSALIIGDEKGRWNTNEINENYPGFPGGISAKSLRYLMLKQALQFGVAYQEDKVENIAKKGKLFVVTSAKNLYKSKSLILATGVEDKFPRFPHWQEYVGRSLFWCITCDGHKTINKKVLVVGQDNEAVCDCLQFKNLSNMLTFVTNAVGSNISQFWIKRLQDARIPFYNEVIAREIGRDGMFEKVILQSGKEIIFDYMFSEQGMKPKNRLAKILKVALTDDGYIIVDEHQKTNISFVYAAGDITKPFEQQITAAVHEGSTAAVTANYDLYAPWQKM